MSPSNLSFRSKTDVYVKYYSAVLFRMYSVQPISRANRLSPHIVCAHISFCAHIQHEAVVLSRVAHRTKLHVHM